MNLMKLLFGSRNDRAITRMRGQVARITALEPTISALDDAGLRAKTDEFRSRLASGTTLDALLPGATTEAGANRRTALKAALGVGYAASVMPIMAQTAIKTPADGLRTGEITYEVNGFKVPAFYAAPAGKTNLPVVLVIQEIFGVHEYIADTARRFAKAGYLAIAPELYARQGDPSKYGEIAKLQAEGLAGAARFAAGAGRHGQPADAGR